MNLGDDDFKELEELELELACDSMISLVLLGHPAGLATIGRWPMPHPYNGRVYSTLTYAASTA